MALVAIEQRGRRRWRLAVPSTGGVSCRCGFRARKALHIQRMFACRASAGEGRPGLLRVQVRQLAAARACSVGPC